MDRRMLVNSILIVAAGCVLTSCADEQEPDAWGNVEATAVVVSSEVAGRIEQLRVTEGMQVSAGAVVGAIDTTQARLETEQIAAQRAAQAARAVEIQRQIDALEVQRAIARRAYERTRRLYESEAATAQQLDQTERDYRVLGEEIDVARARIDTIRREVDAVDARLAQVQERVSDAEITNPVVGTVLAVYASAGENIQAGQPLYRIANLDVVEVRAWVDETQLAGLRTGQIAHVNVDAGDQTLLTRTGTLTWISPEAEFTPTPIQTREERADLVYAITIRVGNADRVLKLGMPVDVRFSAASDGDA